MCAPIAQGHTPRGKPPELRGAGEAAGAGSGTCAGAKSVMRMAVAENCWPRSKRRFHSALSDALPKFLSRRGTGTPTRDLAPRLHQPARFQMIPDADTRPARLAGKR